MFETGRRRRQDADHAERSAGGLRLLGGGWMERAMASSENRDNRTFRVGETIKKTRNAIDSVMWKWLNNQKKGPSIKYLVLLDELWLCKYSNSR